MTNSQSNSWSNAWRLSFFKVLRPVLLASLGLLPLLGAAQCIKTVRWYDDAPFSFKGRDGQLRGANIELMRAILKTMRCDVKFVEMPWARALIELQAGRLDLLPGALYTPEREQFAYFSRPLNRSPNRLFMSAKAASRYRLSNLADIVGTRFRLGAQIGVFRCPQRMCPHAPHKDRMRSRHLPPRQTLRPPG